MPEISVLTLGDYQTNCYIVHAPGNDACCVIDPGYEPEIVAHFLKEKGWRLDSILLTHCHFDHVGGVKILAADTDCRVYLCPEDLKLPPILTNGQLFYTDTYTDEDTVTAAGLTFRVMQTPGHTPGSVCLFCENALFSGDTLFAGSCGRTDLPGGSSRDMKNSLKKLAGLAPDYQVYPGHGEATTLKQEQAQNPYLYL